MSELLTEIKTESAWCPVCPDELGVETEVEPEVDGDHRYYECLLCGYAWGWQRVSDTVRVEGSCAIGVPESVRKAASLPAQRAEQILNSKSSPVSLGMPEIRTRI